MRIKIDECLPVEISDLLSERGYKAETVRDEGLTGSPDDVIWKTAKNEELFLITSDLDFSDIRRFMPGTHPGLLLLRLKKEGKNHILSYIRKLISDYNFNDWAGCFIVATDHKIRVKKSA